MLSKINKGIVTLMGLAAVAFYCVSPQAKEPDKAVVDFNAVTEQESTQETSQEENGTTIKKDSGNSESSTLFNGSDVETGLKINENYQFGDDILPEVDSKNFFERIYEKMFKGLGVAQQVGAYIMIFFMIISLISIVVSFFGAKNKILWFIGAFCICLIGLVADLYAIQIASAFVNFFAS